MDSDEERYFLGPVILVQRDDFFEIVDGQQRLTTLTILFCVIRDLYGNKLKSLDEKLINRLHDAVKSLVRGQHRIKLITQLREQNKFEHEILNEVLFPEYTLSKKEKRMEKFKNAAFIFKQRLEEIKNKEGLKRILDFANYTFNNVEMICINCLRREYAIKLFQVLNTRGLDLNPADLIKSQLYSTLNNELEKKKFITAWNDI